MKTEILEIMGDWKGVVDLCRSTVGKEPLGHEPSTEFKRKILIAEHSPIRNISIKWRWENIPSWVATHWSRHSWECFIKSQRSDRTGIDRNKLPQDAPVTFTGIANAQHLIDTWRKRLCYQAAPETREYAEDLKVALHEVEPEIADVLVPACVAKCGCCELKPCGLFEMIMIQEPDISSENIQKRYNAYNRYFFKKHNSKRGVKPDKEVVNYMPGPTIKRYYCPKCGNELESIKFARNEETGVALYWRDRLCSECGVEIDWSEEG